jgi:hypothetical protein
LKEKDNRKGERVMSQTNLGIKAFVAYEAIALGIRVKLHTVANQVAVSGADEATIGVSLAAAGAGEQVAIALLGGRTHKVCASGAVAVNTAIYPTAAGKVDDAGAGSGSAAIGYSLEAALATGDLIECLLNA